MANVESPPAEFARYSHFVVEVLQAGRFETVKQLPTQRVTGFPDSERDRLRYSKNQIDAEVNFLERGGSQKLGGLIIEGTSG